MNKFHRRNLLAGLCAVPLVSRGAAGKSVSKTPKEVPEHDKWYFDIEYQSWRNTCLKVELTTCKVCELQIRFSKEIDDMDPYVVIESIGKGPLGWSPHYCSRCHIGMNKKQRYCSGCAEILSKTLL